MSGVTAGCEAWSNDVDADIGMLVLHGFTGSPASMRPLGESLAAEGFAVEVPRLPGHGTRWQDLQRTTIRDWARETVAAFERVRARSRAQIIVGQSVGGTLALWLAATRADDVAGIVLINPSIRNRDPRLAVLPLLKWVVPSQPGVVNDIAKPDVDEQGYDRMPLKALASQQWFQKRVRGRLAAVHTPTLVLTSRQDHLIDPSNSREIVAGISSRDVEHVWLERSYHVATLDYDADEIVERTVAFAQRVADDR